jgi:hypothetical protein
MPRLFSHLATLLFCACSLMATEYHGIVSYAGLPLPGATLTATQGDKTFSAVTDPDGRYSFPNLPDGDYSITVEMLCFSPVKKDVTIAFGVPSAEWELKLLPAEEIKAASVVAPPPPATTETLTSSAAPTASTPAAPAKASAKQGKNSAAVAPQNTPSGFQKTDVNASAAPPPSEAASAAPAGGDASDSMAINGSVNNGAASPFGQSQAFGNNRRGPGSLYNGAFQIVSNNSALDATPYSITGQDTPKASQNLLNFGASVGGPIRIPRLYHPAQNAPSFFFGYQLIRNRTATTNPYLLPTAAQRAGDISPTDVVPVSLISPQALSLLRFYPMPNFTSASNYNYQTAIRNKNETDQFQGRVNKTINRTNQIQSQFSFQDSRTQAANLFGFLDTTDILGYDVNVSLNHRFTQRLFMTYKIDFSRQSTTVTPQFANKENVSGEAGITGNLQDPRDWGPPSLGFSSGIAGLSDGTTAANKNQTAWVGLTGYFIRSPHNFTFGADYKRQEFNSISQSNPRGSFTFTGAGTGNDFQDFLTGVVDTSSIAYGNADKYFRANLYDAYVTDDWRVTPGLTLNIGARYEYNSPISEIYGRLVNLDIASGYTNSAPVIGFSPTGSLTGQKYPSSLVRPDRAGIQPRIGLAWRPISGSSLVVRAGYGMNFDTSAYQSIASRMAQQSPLSKSLSVSNSLADPLTLANGFNASPTSTATTFAIDPNFRLGYVHTWQVSIQRDLPGSLILNATYLGIKGTRGVQSFYPNTYPSGVTNPCATCEPGYIYVTSNGNSESEQGNVQLRRRLHNGFTATLVYTYAKSIDDAALGGRGQGTAVVAQNWLDLSAERALSTFDQRHNVNFTMQYTTGVGVHGGMLEDGWRGTLFKEWTITTAIAAGTGTPLTPQYFSALTGTSCTSCIRPNYTGASLYDAPTGLFLNPAAYAPPLPGQFGNAGRDSIEGPDKFSLNASMQRTFRYKSRYNLDVRLDTTNALNHVTYTGWVTNVTSPSFGSPQQANAQRVVQATLRMRF